MSRPRAFLAAAIFIQILRAQPGIQQNGVVNLASQMPPTLEGGAIARGALFTIYGVRLGTSGHVTAAILRGEASAPVEVISARPRQIAARMPLNAPLGAGSLIVTVDGKPSKPFSLEIAASNPGLFSRNLQGWGPGRIQNIDARGGRSENTRLHPARRGQRISLAASGMGNVASIDVIIGARVVKASVGRGARAGEENIVLTLPADAPLGCWVPVSLQSSAIRASNSVTLTITAASEPCDPGPFPWLPGKSMAVAVFSRTRMKALRADAPDALADAARVSIQSATQDMLLQPIQLLPPAGTCTNYTSSAQAQGTLVHAAPAAFDLEGQGLDAGSPLVIRRGAGGQRTISRGLEAYGTYRQRIGTAGFAAKRGSPPLFLDPGDFVLSSPGGKQVGDFNAPFRAPVPFEWPERDQIRVVDRRRGVTLHWRDPNRDNLMVIVALNQDEITTAIGMCLCTANSSSGQFTIPAAMLGNVPASRDIAENSINELAIASLPRKPESTIRARGLDGGMIYTLYANGRSVEYR